MILRVENARVVYGRGTAALAAVDGVSLAVMAGGTHGLVGESGSGKSSLARAIVGLAPLTAGSLELEGEDFSSEKRRNSPLYRSRVQMVFQDPVGSLNPRMTIGETLREALRRRRPKLAQQALAPEARSLLELVRLPVSALDRYPHQFSGGQAQRIAIARALAVRPKVLVTDEVTSALDVSVQASILNLLKDVQKELGLGYLFISHDLSVVRYMSDEISVMNQGEIVEAFPVERIFEPGHHAYTESLLASIPKLSAA
jgi:peptide/nickel transport system ATP-binding protein